MNLEPIGVIDDSFHDGVVDGGGAPTGAEHLQLLFGKGDYLTMDYIWDHKISEKVKKSNIKSKKIESSGGSAARKSLLTKVGIGVLILAMIALFIVPNVMKAPATTSTDDSFDEVPFTKEGTATISDLTGKPKVTIDAEFADTEYDRQRGLMFRRSMLETQGMLFFFPVEEMQSFWMRNTYISLDMIFIDANKRVVTIHRNTKTLSDQSYPSTKPAKYVLEVVAGFCDKHGVREGDLIGF